MVPLRNFLWIFYVTGIFPGWMRRSGKKCCPCLLIITNLQKKGEERWRSMPALLAKQLSDPRLEILGGTPITQSIRFSKT